MLRRVASKSRAVTSYMLFIVILQHSTINELLNKSNMPFPPTCAFSASPWQTILDVHRAINLAYIVHPALAAAYLPHGHAALLPEHKGKALQALGPQLPYLAVH